MGCRFRCESPTVAGGTTCIDVSGTGVTGDPLQISENLAPTLPYPLVGGTLPNGISCGPTGLEVAADRQPSLFLASAPIGYLPVITTDMAAAPWGARLEYDITNLEANRLSVVLGWIIHPPLHVILEPGATMTYAFEVYNTPAHNDPPGLLAPWYGLSIWHFENNGTGLIRYDTPYIHDGPNFGETFGPAEPFGTFAWKGYQAIITTTGFTGASNVGAGIFGSGPGAHGFGIAV